MLALSCSNLGCHRSQYRAEADCEVDQLIAEKTVDPRWAISDYRVTPDPRSRFADPYCPDHPPMPVDDPAAEWLSPKPQCPDCVSGPYEGTEYLQLLPPADVQPGDVQPGDDDSSPSDPLNLENDTVRLITPDNAYDVGLLNSRDYQDRRESLYLAALDVSLERFAFAPQFFGTQQLLYEHVGRLLPGNGSRLTLDESNLQGTVVAPGESPSSEAANGQAVGPLRWPWSADGIRFWGNAVVLHGCCIAVSVCKSNRVRIRWTAGRYQ